MRPPARLSSSPSAHDPTSVSEAQARLLEATAQPAGTESLALDAALGRVLARHTCAAVDVPGTDNSAMDGYAVATRDLSADTEAWPVSLPVVARICAGDIPLPLTPGNAARIFTGATIPAGADAVVMQEHCHARDGIIEVDLPVVAGQNIRRTGEDFRSGDSIVEAGTRLEPRHLGLLSAAGLARVEVFKRPRVRILSTGNELIRPGESRQSGQTYDSNEAMLRGLLTELGCVVPASCRVPDSKTAIREALEEAGRQCDLVISSGGVSVGDSDHVRAALAEAGRMELWRVALKPGKPLAFGNIHGTPFLGLPGNPVAVFVTFCILAAPLIRKLAGRLDCLPVAILLPAGFDRTAGPFDQYLRVRVESGRLVPHARQGSGVLSSLVQTDGLARVPAWHSVGEGHLLEFYAFDTLSR